MNLVLISYAIAAAAFGALALVLVVARRFQWPFNYLLFAALLLVAWSIGLGLTATAGISFDQMVAIDALHAFAILLFVGQLVQARSTKAWQRMFGLLPWLIPLIAGLIHWQSVVNPADRGSVAFYFVLAMTVAGLLGVEQLFRNADGVKRRTASLLAFSFGAVFVFDLFVYSNAVLSAEIDPQLWAARGFVNAMVVPVVLLALKRDSDWQSGFFVSRQVVFYSTTLVGVGVYLLLVAFGGALMQQVGGEWGTALRATFFAASALLLLLVIFSQQIRRRLKVFLATHFYANRYDYREEWLKLIGRLAQDSERAPMPELCLDALMDIIESDGGVLWLRGIDSDSDYLIAAALGERILLNDLDNNHELVRFIRDTGWVVDGREAEQFPERYRNAFQITEHSTVTAGRLFVPISLDGELIGIACLLRPAGMPAMNFEDHDLLSTVGQQAAVFLQRDRNRELLAEAREFEVFNKFTAFIMHDLKNLIAQQSLVVQNAERHKSNPEFVDDAIHTIANSVARMTKLLEQLQGDASKAMDEPIDLAQLLRSVIEDASVRPPAPTLDVQANPKVVANSDRLGAVLGHVIRNAQDASAHLAGRVDVTLRVDGATACVDVVDNGMGMDATFIREQLFKPFESTKGAKGMGIGAYQAREYVRQIGGTLHVESSKGDGSHFTISLPSQ
ncbi:MAG: XrtA/PEP-CTERM system histidine kinase PrsK [Pseudomonadota bacterium]